MDIHFRRQTTVEQWVSLRTIFKVCTQEETWYAGGGRRQSLWWWKTAADAHLRATIKDILEDAWEQRRRASRRCGGRGDQEEPVNK